MFALDRNSYTCLYYFYLPKSHYFFVGLFQSDRTALRALESSKIELPIVKSILAFG